MIYKPIKLDRDLWVDRTKIVQPDDLILIHPEVLRIQSSYIFQIANYNPRDNYEITFSKGTWTFNQGYIQYTTPDDYFGPLKLRIKQTKAPFQGYVLFEDGTIYTEDGTILKADKTPDGKWVYDDQYSNYEEDFQKFQVETPALPVPTTKVHNKTTRLGDYTPSNLFGDLGSVKLNKSLAALKNGNVMDYYLPSERVKTPDERKFFYRTQNGKFIAIPRNSNVTESGGDVFTGYRKPGEVGGSLTVYKGPDKLDRTFEWDFEILLWGLEAVVPDEIISLCLTTVEFTPVLRGIATGHTYLWEQISGDQSTVIWLTPKNQKDVVIDLGNMKVDRVFRFWISKGTRYEKYYDIHIYGTPFDRITNAANAGMVVGVHQNHLNIKVHECSPILLSYQNIWNKQLRVNIVRNY